MLYDKLKDKDKIEITKQQQAEIQKVLDSKIIPHENHTLFEVDLKELTIRQAEYLPPKTTLHWWEALEMFYNRKFKTVSLDSPTTITKSELVRKENCLYIPALNKRNVKKILERDFKIKIN